MHVQNVYNCKTYGAQLGIACLLKISRMTPSGLLAARGAAHVQRCSHASYAWSYSVCIVSTWLKNAVSYTVNVHAYVRKEPLTAAHDPPDTVTVHMHAGRWIGPVCGPGTHVMSLGAFACHGWTI